MFKLAVLVLAALCAFTNSASTSTSVVSTGLLQKLQHGESSTIIVYMKQSPETHLENFRSVKFQKRATRVNAVVTSLRNLAHESQKEVMAVLAEGIRHRSIKVQSLFTSNTVIVQNADYATVKSLMSLGSVAKIIEDGEVPVHVMETQVGSYGKSMREAFPMATWGIKQIRANLVWDLGYTGKGVVVGQIDTGVRHTHEALTGRWREENGWLDPSTGSSTPTDDMGLGTHALETILGAGRNEVGVAPKAQWISCRGCPNGACANADLLKCGDFMACPSGGSNCGDSAPHIVNSIWGGSTHNEWFDGVIAAWRSAGIVTVFPANGRVTCSSLGSPADHIDVFTAGVSTATDDVSAGSGRGPVGSYIKPNVVAPAESTLSAWNTGDDHYSTVSGTTYSAAHAAGVFALVRQAAGIENDVSVVDLTNAVHRGAEKIVASLEPCGGIPNDRFPNNVAGYGRLDAVGAVDVFRRTNA